MLNLYFLVNELVILGLFLVCLVHAARQGWAGVARLLSGVVFGLLLELATIRQLQAYHYGTFGVMVFNVPLIMAVAWGSIAYSAMTFSNAARLPEWARPILDGLLALNIDLAMDAVAIRLGMWDWGQGLRFNYFGVPFANFWAWFWVIVWYSAGYRLAALIHGRTGRALAPFAAVVIGVGRGLGHQRAHRLPNPLRLARSAGRRDAGCRVGDRSLSAPQVAARRAATHLASATGIPCILPRGRSDVGRYPSTSTPARCQPGDDRPGALDPRVVPTASSAPDVLRPRKPLRSTASPGPCR
jgi:hypothetical protein